MEENKNEMATITALVIWFLGIMGLCISYGWFNMSGMAFLIGVTIVFLVGWYVGTKIEEGDGPSTKR